MFHLNRMSAAALLGLVLATSTACTRSDEPGSTEAQGAKATALAGDAPDAIEAQGAKATALAGDALDAVDLLIVMSSLDNARGWNRTLDLSPGLRERLSKYDGKVHFSVQIKGVSEPLLANGGAKTEIPAGAQFGGKLTGALNADVKIASGEVGVIKGEIFVSEGTEATVNGKHYKYTSGQWTQDDALSK